MSLTCTEQYFLTFFTWRTPQSIIFTFRGTPTHENEHKTQTQLEAHGHYSSSANWQSKTSLDISRDIWKFLWFLNIFIFPTISPGNRTEITRNPSWDTPAHNMRSGAQHTFCSTTCATSEIQLRSQHTPDLTVPSLVIGYRLSWHRTSEEHRHQVLTVDYAQGMGPIAGQGPNIITGSVARNILYT
jgi:hypothetical protein